MAITLKINGENKSVSAPEGTPLLWVLRDHLGMTGTKFGCGVAQCGACTVHVDGTAIRSCITAHEDAEGLEITTIEGKEGKEAAAIRKAWDRCGDEWEYLPLRDLRSHSRRYQRRREIALRL